MSASPADHHLYVSADAGELEVHCRVEGCFDCDLMFPNRVDADELTALQRQHRADIERR